MKCFLESLLHWVNLNFLPFQKKLKSLNSRIGVFFCCCLVLINIMSYALTRNSGSQWLMIEYHNTDLYYALKISIHSSIPVTPRLIIKR